MRPSLPALYHHHRGFAMVAIGICVVHLFGALDELLPHANLRHSAPAFAIHNDIFPAAAWGAIHIMLLSLLVVGMYQKRLDLFLIRVSCALSMSVFSLLTISFCISAIQQWPHASLYGTGVNAMAALCSFAALLEPGVQKAVLKSHFS